MRKGEKRDRVGGRKGGREREGERECEGGIKGVQS